MKSRMFAAIAAVVLAVLGIGALVAYAAGAQARAYDGAELVNVYRVVSDLPANADAAAVESSVELVELPNAAVAKGAVKDLADVAELRTTVPLVVGEQLVESRFNKEGSTASQGEIPIPEGLQLIALSLDSQNVGGPNVVTDSLVGVIVTVETETTRKTSFVANKVRVADVKRIGEGPEAGALVSLAVNKDLAEKIAGAAATGVIRLTSQNETTK